LEKYPKPLQTLIYLAIIVLSLVVALLLNQLMGDLISRFWQAATSIILPFSIALFISYLMAPLFQLLEKKFKQPNRFFNTIIIFGGVGILLFFFLRFAGTMIYEQGRIFIENDWPNVQNAILSFVDSSPFFRDIYDRVTEIFTIESIAEMELDVFAVFQSVTNIIITIVLVPVFLFFILNDRDKIYEGVIIMFPKKTRTHAINLLNRANAVITQYFNGRFITMFIMAIVFTVMFFVLGFRERSFLFGFMLGFFDIVPYVGPFIAMILPVLYSLTDDTLRFGEFAPVVITLSVIVGQIIQNNVAQPLIMGKETKIHPLLVLSAFVFFGYLFGVVGIILAIPITGMIRTTYHYFLELHEEKIALKKQEKELMNEESEPNESH